MKKTPGLLIGLSMLLLISTAACGKQQQESTQSSETELVLSDDGVMVNGSAASTDSSAAVYVGNEIVYYHDQDAYESGSPYGAGSSEDQHTEEEAAKHTAVTITQAGTYRISGKLSYGQIAVDLGENAVTDPAAVVTLILDNVDLNCDIAPAIIFYNVYECGDADAETGGIVDTTAAGANVVIADDSTNYVTGANVAKIYKDGTEEKLHKYDGALYSIRSMNVDGEENDTGKLYITSTTHEGLDSEMHLTINGGMLYIEAQNDGINTNEDMVSVTTVNGGTLTINAGLGGEGDGIDSNGWLVINGGTIISVGNGQSGDGGIDADGGITINGGTVYAFGSRNDSVETAPEQNVMQLTFASVRDAGSTVSIRDSEGNVVMEYTPEQMFQSVTLSSPELDQDAAYSVYVNDVQQEYSGTRSSWKTGPDAMSDMEGGMRPETMQLPDGVEEWLDSDTAIPEEIRTWLENLVSQYQSARDLNGENDRIMPTEISPGEAPEQPENGDMPERSDGIGQEAPASTEEASTIFTLTDTISSFSGLADSTDVTGESRITVPVNDGDGTDGVTETAAFVGASERDPDISVSDFRVLAPVS